MFEELYNSCVTKKDKQRTIETMVTKMQEKWDPATDFNDFTNRQDQLREVTNKCGTQATNSEMIC